MKQSRRLIGIAALALVIAACGERLIYEAGTDPTLVDTTEASVTTQAEAQADDPPAQQPDSGTI